MREESIFIGYLGRSNNDYISSNKGNWLYNAQKKEAGWAVVESGARLLRKFDRPVELDFYPRIGPGNKRWDISNYGLSVKILEDQIVRCGLLKDDSNAYVTGIGLKLPIRIPVGPSGFLVVIRESCRISDQAKGSVCQK